MKNQQDIIKNIRNRINNNAEEVVNEINGILSQREYSSITDEWKKGIEDSYGSYSFLNRELKQYGYGYSSQSKVFEKIQIVNDENENKNLRTIKESLTSEKYNYVVKSICIDKDTYDRFDELAKKSYLSKSYLTTLLFKNFIDELEKGLD